MPQAPAAIGNLVESALGRPAQVLDLRQPAPDFLELELRATAPPGGWHPGHEIQIRVTPTLGRRYTVRTVDGPDAERIGILAATDASGPGTAWLRRLRTGDRTTLLAGRHRPLRTNGTRRLHLGDGCALGTLDAYARDSGALVAVAVEVPADAVEALTDRWSRYRFLPAAQAPGDALQAWLERSVGEGELRALDGALLLGHARSVQRQRHALVDSRTLPRRAITTKPYWATGRAGLQREAALGGARPAAPHPSTPVHHREWIMPVDTVTPLSPRSAVTLLTPARDSLSEARQPMGRLRVLISGASIAGPALALCLARYGADVTVVERWPELRTGGQLVDLRGVSRGAVRRMGVDPQVRAERESNFGLSFVDGQGRTKGSLRADQFGGDGPVAEIEILRGVLSKVLHEQSLDRVDYRLGDRITSVHDDGTKVHVEFTSAPAESFDVVVGADGLHSELREMLFGPETNHLHHLGTYISFWTARNHTGLKDWTVAYSEPGRTIGMRSILGNTKVMAFFSFRAGQPSYDWRDVDAQVRIVKARASGMGWEAAALLSQIDTAPDFYFDTCSQVTLPKWSAGRVGLVGDAAYCASPLSGHGATIAMVGAYVLAGELASTPEDITGAFTRYERKLRPWIGQIQRTAPDSGKTMTPQTAYGIAFRNNLVRLASHVPGKELLIRSQINRSNAFTLDDYSRHVAAA